MSTDVSEFRSAQAPADPRFMQRWSPRAFSGKSLSADQLEILFEAARWAPSCFNSQPWRFVYAINGDEHWQSLLGLLMDMNQAWAQHAGALIALVSKNTFDHNDQPAPTAAFDAGAAWMSMALQAQEMELVSHAMWGFHHDKAPAVLGLTEDYTARAMIAVGYPGDVSVLPEKYQERELPSPRKSIQEIAHPGQLQP